jgi:hypothetical protein
MPSGLFSVGILVLSSVSYLRTATAFPSLFSKARLFSTVIKPPAATYLHQTVKMAELIDGNLIAAQIRTELKDNVKLLHEALGVTPGLAVLLVGERKDSATYVRMKKKACLEVGVNSYGFDFPGDVSEADVIAKIDELNAGKCGLCGHQFYWNCWCIFD